MAEKVYKLVLVEDESIIRENIKKSIEWSKYGYEFCGEAANGEQALEIIEEVMPDVVITDIRMPFMDGIELSRICKTLYPKMNGLVLLQVNMYWQTVAIGCVIILVCALDGFTQKNKMK